MRQIKELRLLAFVVLSAVSTTASMPAHAQTYVSTIIAAGLNNPRGLAFGTDGGLYIAEGGTFNPGGPVTMTAEGPAAYGETGSITRLLSGIQTRIITGLPSLTNISSGAASGPADIAFYNGVGYFLTGLGANPAARYTDLGSIGSAANLASLFSFSGSSVTKVADLGSYEQSVNPTGDQIDSNPFHLTAGPAGLLVTDAGANSLLNVTQTGAISAKAIFPQVSGTDAVPTGISVGPDGAFYVGQLTGFPFVPGAADIFRIDATTGAKTIFATGFTNITDIAWGADGRLYVLEFAENGILSGPPGALIRLNADGSQTKIFGGLIAPTGLTIGADGAFYVTNFSPAPGGGQVLRISAVAEPASWAMLIIGLGLAGSAMRRRMMSVQFA